MPALRGQRSEVRGDQRAPPAQMMPVQLKQRILPPVTSGPGGAP